MPPCCALCAHPRDDHEPDSFTGMAPCEGVFHRDEDGRHRAYPCDCQDFLDGRVSATVPELEGIE